MKNVIIIDKCILHKVSLATLFYLCSGKFIKELGSEPEPLTANGYTTNCYTTSHMVQTPVTAKNPSIDWRDYPQIL